MIRNYLLSVFALLSILSCTKKNIGFGGGPVRVNVMFENSSGKTSVNRSYNIDIARLYLSHFELIDNAGNTKPVKDLLLANKDNDFDANSFSFDLPSGTYTKLRFHFGLDPATNNSNPSTFDVSNPLSLSQDMYWGMLKYRFIVVEGQIDSSVAKNQIPANPFSMHLGTDTLYRQITSDLNSIKEGGQITIHIDLSKLFILDQNTFDITNFSNHSSTADIPNAIAITNNLTNAIHADIVYPL
ncbi:MAG: hypothetical protein JWN78_2872 [Bacteroidota bacterium]|nr:hypothetical protein [Bacteroidota bacterium]